MVISSLDTASSSSWLKNKPGQTGATKSSTPGANLAAREAAVPVLPSALPEVESKREQQQQQQRPSEEELATATAARPATAVESTGLAATRPDFTLKLSSQEASNPAVNHQTTLASKAATEAPKRAKLPYTFNFGIRRPQALQVVMNRPLLGNAYPANFGQAIQQTLDLAATNRLPYEKGRRINLLA